MLNTLRYQWQLFLLALSFLSRIPIKITSEVNAQMLNHASRYFALIGVVIGTLCAIIFVLISFIFDSTIAVLLTMAFSLMLTGAFHEDGWADVWDGFGGGWQVKDKLNIMKDSRLGTYGAAALFIILLLKYQSLSLIAQSEAPAMLLAKPYTVLGFHIEQAIVLTAIALVLAHTLSRMVATSLIKSMVYVSEDQTSKVKPLAAQLSGQSLLVLLSTGIVVLYLATLLPFFTLVHALYLVLTLFIIRQVMKYWFNNQLGGFTGDCLGAAQQVTEVSVYLFFLAIC